MPTRYPAGMVEPVSAQPRSAIPRNPGRHDLGMKATLLFPSREIVERFYVPLIYTACRTCYSELEPAEIFRRAEAGEIDRVKMQKLISGVIESGHGSTIEHVVFTFGISGVSRTLSHQLVRHRAGVAFDQQSRRLFQLIRHEVFAVSPFLGSFLAPKCVPLGYCDEMGNRDEHCPIRPHRDSVLGAWAEKAKAARTGDRDLTVVDG